MRSVLMCVAKEFFDFDKSLCSFILLNEMFFNSVSQSLRRFLVWYELHDCFHFVRNSLMKTLSMNASLFLSFFDSFAHIVCLYLILRFVDVSSTFRRRRFRASNKRCLICSQKFLISVSCLCFFIRCLNEICRRVMCSWMNWTCVFASRICIETALKLSLIWRRLCCCSLTSFFVAATTLFERSCDACQMIES